MNIFRSKGYEMKNLILFSSIAVTLLTAILLQAEPGTFEPYLPPELDKGIPRSLNLPKNFKPRDLKEQKIYYNGMKAVALKKQGSTYPFLITGRPLQKDSNSPLGGGDVVLSINGKPLGKNCMRQFRQTVNKTRKNPGFVWITRWRPSRNDESGTGNITQVLLDLGGQPLDLRQTGKPGGTHDWALGPIGANGWGFNRNTRNGASEEARQLIITLVEKNTPADGILQVGDVITGVNGKTFDRDARKVLAEAINEAEKEENKGKLSLTVYRPSTKLKTGKGETKEVIITLPVMGTFSPTSPFDCPKTEKIIDNAVSYMKANADKLLKYSDQGWINYINGLGLLATGRDDVMPLVKKLAHDSMLKEGEKLSVEKHIRMMCWWWSYKTLFLCEYYLRTGDKAVLPTIEEHATKIAMGQSGAGTWGHTFAARSNTGYYHGHLGGYGAINQQGLTLMIVLPLAVKCGVKNKEVMDAIERGNKFFSYFIGKGTIPYGDHGPNIWYDDNGKSGSAAIFFDLMGNRKGTKFFSEMILGSAPSGREQGHTGHFWSHLWGGVGALRGGDKCLQEFMKEMNYIFTLERQSDGRFAFQRNIGENGESGKRKDKWDCTGARLLQLCAPRRLLYITGKETPRETHLTSERIQEIFKAGKLDVSKQARAKLTQEEIFDLLKDPLPPTRATAAEALAELNINCVDKLIEMLDSDNKYARYGAAQALCKAGFGSKEAADKLIKIMEEDDDITFKGYAIEALINRDEERGLLTVAKPAIPVLLKMAVKKYPDDPRGVLQQIIARALFYNGTVQPRKGLLTKYGIEEVPRELLFPAIKAILTNQNGKTRSATRWVLQKLKPEELDQLWGDIYKATNHIAPSGIMFAPQIRLIGLKLMSDNKIKEGLDLAAWYVRYQKEHAAKIRIPDALKAIEKYGAHAKRVIPQLKEHAEYYENYKRKNLHKSAELIRETVKRLEALPDEPKSKLESIADQLDNLGIKFPPKPIVIQNLK